MTEKNPQEYGYKENTEIKIDEKIFGAMVEIAESLAQAETKVGVEMKGSIEETFNEKNTTKHFTSVLGLKAFALIENLNAIHERNVEDGTATHESELNKAKISVLGSED